MPRFASFDKRNYRTVSSREGCSLWAATYEGTIKHDMDIWLLEKLQTVAWNNVKRCADLGCGTGRTAAWLATKGVRLIDGVDTTPEMLERGTGAKFVCVPPPSGCVRYGSARRDV